MYFGIIRTASIGAGAPDISGIYRGIDPRDSIEQSYLAVK